MGKVAAQGVEAEVELTAREELEEIAALLHSADIEEKEAKAFKEQARPAFFELISEVVREEVPLARKTVRVDDPKIDPEEWRAFNEPTMRIIAIQPDENGWDLTLEENEAFVKYEFEVGGYKFGRTIRMEGKDFKAEAFYDRVRVAAQIDGVSPDAREALMKVVSKEMVPVYSVDEDEALRIMTEYPETVAIFQKYMFPGTPKPALMPIKEVKEK